MRTEFTLPAPSSGPSVRRGVRPGVASRFDMAWRLWDSARPKRVAMLVSRYDHCLLDLLWRWRRGELDAEIVLVAPTTPTCATASRGSACRTTTSRSRRTASPRPRRSCSSCSTDSVDLVVLARYMQILSGDFLERVGVPVINIHHSFLPAFAGAGPYQQANARGVKLIGATAHYVTEELDAGPIIEQDVVRVSHRDGVRTLVRLGAEIERGAGAGRPVALRGPGPAGRQHDGRVLGDRWRWAGAMARAPLSPPRPRAVARGGGLCQRAA